MHGAIASDLFIPVHTQCAIFKEQSSAVCRLAVLATGSMVNMLSATGVQTISAHFSPQIGRRELSVTVLATALSRAIGKHAI
jgi:hypothetical protein